MDDKKKMNESELENVVGGLSPNDHKNCIIYCENTSGGCNFKRVCSTEEEAIKSIKSYYKNCCPNCRMIGYLKVRNV